MVATIFLYFLQSCLAIMHSLSRFLQETIWAYLTKTPNIRRSVLLELSDASHGLHQLMVPSADGSISSWGPWDTAESSGKRPVSQPGDEILFYFFHSFRMDVQSETLFRCTNLDWRAYPGFDQEWLHDGSSMKWHVKAGRVSKGQSHCPPFIHSRSSHQRVSIQRVLTWWLSTSTAAGLTVEFMSYRRTPLEILSLSLCSSPALLSLHTKVQRTDFSIIWSP